LPVFITGQMSNCLWRLWAVRTLSTLTLSPQIWLFYLKCLLIFKMYRIFTMFYNNIWNNHSERWITRLANRWRAQQSAITIANCRIYWAAITWTQIAASGIPGATFAWGSTINKIQLTDIVLIWWWCLLTFGLSHFSAIVYIAKMRPQENYIYLELRFLLTVYVSYKCRKRF
jgi:hypothetical protein